MIADIRGYTAYTQKHGDEGAARLAAKFAQIAREGIEAHGGELVELRGDEALAVFSSVRASLRAAVELQAVFVDESSIEPDLPLTVGIGIDAGEAVAVEGGYRGGALNLAARLCSKASAGETLVSEGVIHLARAVEGLTVTDHGTVEAKGLSEPVRAYAVCGPATEIVAAPSPASVPPELDTITPMYGRDAQLRQLLWMWRVARRGSGAAVVVRGPSGIGKTRLLAAVAEAVTRGRGTCTYLGLSAEHPPLRDWWASVPQPAVAIVDDVDAADSDDLADLGQLVDADAREQRLLIIGLDDEHATESVHTAVRRWPDRVEVVLPPLAIDQMRAVADLYLPGAADVVPLDLLTATGGVPRQVHRAVSEWVDADATARLGSLAHRAASGRSDLRAVESDLAGTVFNLQQARERTRLFGSGPGRHAVDDRPPYKGLVSFDADDAGSFFGRERLVADLIARLAGSPMLAVVGASGSGKSSVVRAGLVPALQAGVLPESETWHCVVARPTEHPVRAVERALLTGLPRTLVERLPGNAPVLAETSVAAAASDERVVLVVDQFEEVYTLCDDPAERAEFISGLAAAATSEALTVVITIRADFYGRCASDEKLAGLLADHTVLVGAMNADEYRRAIVNPALRVGAAVEPELVEVLVDDVLGEPGALPLLSTTLLELWESRDGRKLQAASYRGSGGVRGAVARLAETVYAEFGTEQQALVRSILLRLAGPGEGDAVVRKRAPLADFGSDAELTAVMQTLADRRLLTVSDGYVEVAHEALLREWPRFTDWLEEDRDGIRLRAHLASAAREWQEAGRDPAELYRGTRLSAALDWTTQHSLELNEVEREFVTSSRTESQRALLAQQRQNRRLRSSLGGVALLLVLALIAGVVALVQRHSAQRHARVALAHSLGAEAVSQPRIDEAMLLARQAVLLDRSPQTEATLLSTLLRTPALVGSFSAASGLRPQQVQLSPDGTTLAVIDNDSLAHFYSATSFRPLPGQVTSVLHQGVWTGSRFVSTGEAKVGVNFPVAAQVDGAWKVIHVLPGSHVWNTKPTGENQPMFASPDGRAFYFVFNLTNDQRTSQGRSYIYRADLKTYQTREVALPAVGMTAGAVTGPNRLTVVTGNAVLTLNATTLAVEHRVALHVPKDVLGALNPAGTKLVYSGSSHPDDFVQVDLRTGRSAIAQGGHSAQLESLGYVPNARQIITTADDGSAIVWDARTLTPIERFAGDNGRVIAQAVSSDSLTLFTCSLDGAIFEWDLGAARRFGRPYAVKPAAPVGQAPGTSPPLAVAPDGASFAVGNQFGAAQLYATKSERRVETLWNGPRKSAVATAVSWSRGGVLAGVANTGDVRLWRTSPGVASIASASVAPGVPTGVSWDPAGTHFAVSSAGPVTSQKDEGSLDVFDAGGRRLAHTALPVAGTAVDYSPDGQRIAVGQDDGRVLVADPGGTIRRTILVSPEQRWRVTSLAFEPSGTLLVGSWNGIVSQWDLATGRQVGPPMLVEPAPVASITVDSATGRFAVTSGSSGGMTIWDPGTGQQFGSAFPGGASTWGNAVYAPDGSKLIAAYSDGTGAVWPVSVDSLMAQACDVARRNFSQDEWERFVPNSPYQRTCPQYPAG